LAVGIFRYIVQGIGWEVGRTAAREGIDHVRNLPEEEVAPPLTEKEKAKLLKQQAAAAAKARAERDAAVKKKADDIEAQLAALKKKA
jgi:NAD(P)-dependent dehydrogenase (short-subunit alcohol dehydrogenase family)